MVWEPFAIAVVFGLVVSAGLYFIVMWPQVEPDDEPDDEPAAVEVDAAPVAPRVVDTAPVDTAPVQTSTVATIPVATIAVETPADDSAPAPDAPPTVTES